MLRIFVVLFLLWSLLVFGLYGQDDGQNGGIVIFDGGTHVFDLSLHSTFFMGMTARSRNFGNSVSSSVFDAHLVSMNPAGMSRHKSNLLTFDVSPSFDFEVNDIVVSNFIRFSPRAELDTTIDSVIDEHYVGEEDAIYPDVTTRLGQTGGLNQIGIIVYDEKWGAFGFSWHRPFHLNMGYISNGTNLSAENIDEITEERTVEIYGQTITYEGTIETKTVLPLSMELFTNTTISMHQSDFAYSRSFGEHFALGGGFNVSNFTAKSSLRTKIDGSLSQSITPFTPLGDLSEFEYVYSISFNDPNVSYYDRNTMDSKIDMDFQGIFVGGVFATNWQPSPKWNFDLVYDTPRSADLRGSLHIVQNKMDVLNLSAGATENILDTAALIDDFETYATRVQYVSDAVSMTLPGKLAISTAWVPSDWRMIVSYEHFFGDIGIDYSAKRYEDGLHIDITGDPEYYERTPVDINYKIGLKPKHTIKMAIGSSHFAMSGQVTIADMIADGITDSAGEQIVPAKNIIIPGLAFGATLSLSKTISMDMSVVAIPAPILRGSLSWKF